jgi:hypothetical protein
MPMIRDEQPGDPGANLTDHDLDLVVSTLRQISREATLDYAIRVGSVIVHYFYDGDCQAFRSKRVKGTSFRRLADRADLPMSPTLLYRCVATFELCERLNVVSRWKHVTVSHLRAVLNLEHQHQVGLLSAANAEHWSVQKLEEHVQRVRTQSASRTGRPPALPVLKCARSLRRTLLENWDVLDSLPDVGSLSEAQREELRETLAQALERLHRAERVLMQYAAGAQTTPPPAPSEEELRANHGAGDEQRLEPSKLRLGTLTLDSNAESMGRQSMTSAARSVL